VPTRPLKTPKAGSSLSALRADRGAFWHWVPRGTLPHASELGPRWFRGPSSPSSSSSCRGEPHRQLRGRVDPTHETWPCESLEHDDATQDVSIELCELVGRHPQLLVSPAADRLGTVATGTLAVDLGLAIALGGPRCDGDLRRRGDRSRRVLAVGALATLAGARASRPTTQELADLARTHEAVAAALGLTAEDRAERVPSGEVPRATGGCDTTSPAERQQPDLCRADGVTPRGAVGSRAGSCAFSWVPRGPDSASSSPEGVDATEPWSLPASGPTCVAGRTMALVGTSTPLS
jgi:hypothetical protein